MTRHLSIYFCNVAFLQDVTITPSEVWSVNENSKGLFVIRSSEALPDTVRVEVSAKDLLIWQSSVRLFPNSGLVHPFIDNTDQSLYYMTSLIIQHSDLATVSEWMDVRVFMDESTLLELPILIEGLVKEDDSEADLLEEHNIDRPVESAKEIELASSARVCAEQAVFEWNDGSMRRMLEGLNAGSRFTLDVNHSSGIDSVGNCKEKFYNIIIEKLDDTFIAVIHEKNTRPFYLLIQSEPIHTWTDSIELYWNWLLKQISTMYNISLKELEAWSSLFIYGKGDHPDPSLPVSCWMPRIEAIHRLASLHPVIIDMENSCSTIQLSFQEQQAIVTIQLYDAGSGLDLEDSGIFKEQLAVREQAVVKLLEPFGTENTLTIGYGKFAAIRCLQDIQTDSRLFNSLAWETCRLQV